jgi:acetyl esterase/lipase
MAASLGADRALPLYDGDKSPDGAFRLESLDYSPVQPVATSVDRPWLFAYDPVPTTPSKGAILILGGGGYIQLMVEKEGAAVARWLTKLGYQAFVLVHRFPNATNGPRAPLDDARRALRVIKREADHAATGKRIGVCGLSSGGHLAAALLAEYPAVWMPSLSAEDAAPVPALDFAIIGYGPISTNAKGRTIIKDKAPLEPSEKQELYDVVQPDVQIAGTPPPTFIVYSANDPIVPVVNAYRLADGLTAAGGSVELHSFANAPHGFALGTKDLPVSQWPVMCEAWLKDTFE